MSSGKVLSVTGSVTPVDLAPMDPSWITEGNPVTRATLLHKSEDGDAETFAWDCTAGKFTWHYTIDEVLTVLEGSAIVTDQRGNTHHLSVGSTMFFPKGVKADWHVENYIRKIAICRAPLSAKMQLVRRVWQRLQGKGGQPQSMFESPAR